MGTYHQRRCKEKYMGKVSKLMKLLSASAIVAGANSVALANCDLCGETNHEMKEGCPNFDYKGFAKEIGHSYTKLDSSEKWFLGTQAKQDRRLAFRFLNVPTATTVSFATPTGDTASSDNTWSNTETTTQSSNEKPGASDKLNTLKFERTQTLSDADTAISESDVESERRAQVRMNRMSARAAARTRSEAYEDKHRAKDLQNLFDEENARKAEEPYTRAKLERARARDSEEVKNMLKEQLARKSLENPADKPLTITQGYNDLERRHRGHKVEEAHEIARENREKINISDDEKKKIVRANVLKRYERREARAHKKAFDAEIARLNEKAAHVNEKAARVRDSEEVRDMLRERVAKDLRKSDRVSSKSDVKDLDLRHRGAEEARGEAYDNRANINISDWKKLRIMGENISQAEGRREARKAKLEQEAATKRQEGESQVVEQDKLMPPSYMTNSAANKIQAAARARLARKKVARLKEEQAAEEQRRLEEEEAERNRLNEERERAEREEEERLFAENRRKLEELEREHQLASEATDGGVADEEVEKDRWSLPIGTSWTFTAAFSFYNDSARKAAERWARQLEDLSIRKIECIFWLITTSYQQLQEAGKFAPTAQMAEAISDVDKIFPYSGTNLGVMNVYNAWENTDTADFVKDLERLGSNGLDGVLYYVAFRYMQLLDDEENQKQAASSKFVELARATLDHFDISWNTENVKFVPDNKDGREAPRDPVNFKAADKGIVETEAPETMTWNPPYRVYYAYCEDLKRGLRPSRKSMELFQDKENREQLYRDELRKLSIRRLEAIIYFAAGAYECRELKHLSEINKSVEDIRKVYQKAVENKQNAREQNVRNAIENMVDNPNDNPISMQPFYKGFTALTTNEQEHAFIDMAIAYREMLRNGKRPANMAFVNFANEVCKISERDGFVNGRDTKPLPEFSEFGNEAKTPQVSYTANANNNPAVIAENHQEPADVGAREPESDWEPMEWELPEDVYNSLEFRYEGYYSNPDRETSNEGQARERLQKQIGALNVRQLEALIGLASSAYTQKLEEGYDARPISNKIAEQAKDIFQLIVRARYGENEHLLNVLETMNKADGKGDFQRDVMRLPARQIEALIAMIAEVYDDKVDEGAVPAAPEFKKFSHDILKLMYLKYYDEEETPAEDEATNDSRRNALEGDNGVLIDPARA